MQTTKYYALGLNALSDGTTFMPVSDDDKEGYDVSAMQSAYNVQIDRIVGRCTEDNTKNTVKRLKSPRNPKFPTMKGNLKLHKTPHALRPVISHVNAPMSRGSKWISRQLSSCVGLISKAHVKDTRDFYDKVRRSKAKGRLLSLDAKSLFTNIPVDEAIEVVRTHSTGDNPTFSLPINPEIFCDILKVCVSFNQFSFCDKYYRQIAGVPMGSSLSPPMANLYMEHFEEFLLEDIPVELRPSLWLRYVDDIFCCFREISKLDEFLAKLNMIRPTIQFTVELSESAVNQANLPAGVTEKLPFLELNVMRSTDGRFIFSIYRKSCHAGIYLHAHSYHTFSRKPL